MLLHASPISYAGGLDEDHLCPVDYRTDIREAKARVDRPENRAILDELGYSVDLLFHALESQLKETGVLSNTHFELINKCWYRKKVCNEIFTKFKLVDVYCTDTMYKPN